MYLVEHKIAYCRIKCLIRIIQFRSISLLESDMAGNALQLCISLALLLGIIPLCSPVVHCCDLCLRKCLCTSYGKCCRTTTDIEQLSVSVPLKMLHQMFMHSSHHVTLSKCKLFMTDKHIHSHSKRQYTNHCADYCCHRHFHAHTTYNRCHKKNCRQPKQHVKCFLRYPVSVISFFVHRMILLSQYSSAF